MESQPQEAKSKLSRKRSPNSPGCESGFFLVPGAWEEAIDVTG